MEEAKKDLFFRIVFFIFLACFFASIFAVLYFYCDEKSDIIAYNGRHYKRSNFADVYYQTMQANMNGEEFLPTGKRVWYKGFKEIYAYKSEDGLTIMGVYLKNPNNTFTQYSLMGGP